ncbi:hypothetical protein Ahy_B08g093643 [Arachis hypogaea]|uniref:Uncharacterized protein n=1 Tax=Arachis hypogaea TaxID=3818 RepID=A0A444Y6T6_ARAHY|nr:hypothetical protein Ahy_B08g093643 [Arachis hypogaea]
MKIGARPRLALVIFQLMNVFGGHLLRFNLEELNPLHNPFLQDPDGVSVTGLIKGDKILHKTLLNELKGATLSLRKVTGKLINDCDEEEEEIF